jgi:hypothetical protein
VGTVKKSHAIRSLAWFFRNVRHACDGGYRGRSMYFETVACEVFRRGADELPRGNMILPAKCVHHDEREMFYRRNVRIARHGSDSNFLKLQEWMSNRIHGTPTKYVEKTVQHESNFYLTTRDGQKQPLFPERQAVGVAMVHGSSVHPYGAHARPRALPPRRLDLRGEAMKGANPRADLR